MVRSKQGHTTPQNQLHSHGTPVAPARPKAQPLPNETIMIKAANELVQAQPVPKRTTSTKPTPRPADPARKLDILLHDGHALGVDSAQIRVFEKVHQEGLGCFLECLDGV